MQFEKDMNKSLGYLREHNAQAAEIIQFHLETAEDGIDDIRRILSEAISWQGTDMLGNSILANKLSEVLQIEDIEASDGIQKELSFGARSCLESIICALGTTK